MGFRLVSSFGEVKDPAIVTLSASGVIHQNGLVVLDNGALAAGVAVTADLAGTNTSATNIFGVSLDGVVGASDTYVRVIPFVQGQIWEADAASAISTASVGLRHQLASDLVVRNITKLNESVYTGVFLCLGVTGLTTGSGKLLGTFLQKTQFRGTDGIAQTD